MPRARAEVFALRNAEVDAAEERVQEAANRTVRLFLSRLIKHARAEIAAHGLQAAALPPFPFSAFTEAQATQWWSEAADDHLLPVLEQTWIDAYHREAGVQTGLDTIPSYLAQVRDRLVPGSGPMLSPTIPEDAFNMARGVISRAIATGDSTQTLARDLAATFSWDHNSGYWEQRKASVDLEIDGILDPLGPPGSPAREHAKINDPRVVALRQDRNLAQARLDSSKSIWENRATRIARTEATGALNAGTLAAMQAEGVSCIEWVSAHDARTRPSHAAVDGSITILGTPFPNGLKMPGDPSAPASQVVNCRCTIVAAACPPGTIL